MKIGAEEKQKNTVEISTTIIKNVIVAVAQANKGFNEDERRIYYKICDAFEKALAEKLESIQIDDNWASFIRKNFKEAKLTPNDLLKKVEFLIEDMK